MAYFVSVWNRWSDIVLECEMVGKKYLNGVPRIHQIFSYLAMGNFVSTSRCEQHFKVSVYLKVIRDGLYP